MIGKKRRAMLIVLVALALAGCSLLPAGEGVSESASGPEAAASEPAAAEGSDHTVYSVYMEYDRTVVMNAAGELLPEEEEFSTTEDILTRTPLLRTAGRMEDTGEEDEYGNPVARTLSALYDLDGNLLWDFEEVRYANAFGDFIIRQDTRPMMAEPSELGEDYETALWNYKTGEVVLDGVYSAQRMDDSSVLLLDSAGGPLGVVDARGSVLSGFPPPAQYHYGRAWNGHILAYTTNPNEISDKGDFREGLFTADLELIAERGSFNELFIGLRGDYLIYTERESGEEGIMDADGNTLYVVEAGSSIEYYDGERIILQTGEWQSEENPTRYRLQDKDGAVLAEDYEALAAGGYFDDDNPADSFIGLSGGIARLLDRDGKVLAERELPDANGIQGQGEGLYTYSAESDGGFCEGLLGPDLEVLVPAGRYSSVSRLSSWNYGDTVLYDYFQCGYFVNNVYRTDIIDTNGQMKIESLSYMGTYDRDRLTAVRGFSVGLMDWDGNWIKEHPIFNQLMDD